ncbi:TIGR04255 family protein [Streptomyces microflavus]|uniref:TIGR04255 family protein n=1 Tax=Streptomyces microflavus TaxID=1919 RepID=UPI00363A5E94
MGAHQLKQPFSDEPYDEVRLPSAPLVRVLCQLKFERMSVLDSPVAARDFAAALSSSYPYLDTSTEINMLIGGGQVMPQSTHQPVWRLRSGDKSKTATLTNGSLALETSSYEGREAFCEELHRVVEVLQAVVKIPTLSRIGVRYTNQVTGAPLAELSEYFRQEISGMSTASLGRAEMLHCLSQASFAEGAGAAGGGFVAQWGMMPPNGGFDPTLPVLAERSFVLDLDAFREGVGIEANPSVVRSEALALAERAYRFLRWAVTTRFLRQYGGDV